ncbi:MAG: S8 family serine peptidase [Halobacteriovoraceae bacterium]|nr:S8 family serine peptidase [Halobacteriovoraceae bacterium]
MNKNFNLRQTYLLLFLFITCVSPLIPEAAANKSTRSAKTSIFKPTKKISTPKHAAYKFEELYSNYASWGISPNEKKAGVNLAEAWKKFKKKKTIVIGVIDTGIDPLHPFIKNNVHVGTGKVSPQNYGMDFSHKGNTEDSEAISNKGSSFLSETALKPMDYNGHGTHVSGIIRSVFPDAKILTLKYYNPDVSGQKNLESTISALEYAVNKNVDIINYSGGGPESSKKELKILKKAQKKGIIIIAAAGNEKSNIDQQENAYYPASYGLPNIITVTAHDKSANLISSANYGKSTVDISAPGHRIKSIFPNNQIGFLSGTSQATAFVTGAVALIKSHYPKISPSKIKNIIRKSSDMRPSLQNKCISGGILNIADALDVAGGKKPKKRTLANKKEGSIIYRYK